MKKYLFITIFLSLVACAGKDPVDIYVPKSQTELAGNGFESFTLGADVHLYMSQDPENSKLWSVQAVVPVKKESESTLLSADMEIVLLDENGIRVRDSYSLTAEDLESIVPVFNSDVAVEKSLVFSVQDDNQRKLFPYKQAKSMLDATKGIRLSINVEEEAAAKPEDIPNTFPWLCKRTNVNGLLAQYERAVRKKDNRKANDIEAKIWEVEKKVKNDDKLPKALRERFINYVENRIDKIDDKY